MDNQTKQCQNCKQDFTIEPVDFEFYEKIKVEAPKDCFHCRLQKRLAFWPFAKFNKRKCDFSGENIISIHSSKARFPVYKVNYWNSDKWEPAEAEYDLNRPFFDQLYELQAKVPRPHQFGTNNQDCDYSEDVWDSKNCYLCRHLLNCENLSYSYRTVRCRDSYDLTYCYDMEKSFDCTYCFKNYNIHYAFDVRDSFDGWFLYDCKNVRNCFMCWNLRNKEYYILNQPYSKETYFEKLKEYNLNSWNSVQFYKKQFTNLIKNEAIHKTNYNIKTVNSSGNFLTECKDCQNSYFFETSENCAYIFRGLSSKDAYDSNGILKGELIYNVMQLTEGYNLKNSIFCTNCRDSEYLDFCTNCDNCFGCVGLKNKSCCILNKQYSKEDYNILKDKIKEAMQKDGLVDNFFPYKMAYGGYNLSFSGILFPKAKEEVAKMGSFWEEFEEADYSKLTISPFIDDVKDAPADIYQKVFVCEDSNRLFNIKKDELEFYRSHQIPLPHYYPDTRTMKRVVELTHIDPTSEKCFFCQKDIISYYPKEWEYKKIACEGCYLKEVA